MAGLTTEGEPMALKALDLFCRAGGASMGLKQAGFDVIGVDRIYSKNYPFQKIVGDAFEVLTWLDLGMFDFIWASPPCQQFSKATPSARRGMHDDLIEPTRAALEASGKPYCMENVECAPMRHDVVLTGDMFGLNTYRKRIFEVNFPVLAPAPGARFGPETRPGSVTVAGGGGGSAGTFSAWCDAMEIHWMNRREIVQAVPLAYARFIADWAKKTIDDRAEMLLAHGHAEKVAGQARMLPGE
jgi:DNA (cytosine-5)-methyltransferase 1